MSVTDRFKAAPDDGAGSWLRRIRANTTQAIALIVRAPRRQVPSWRGPRAAAVAGIAAFAIVALMALADARTVAVASNLPHWVQTAFAEVTDFGKSGWFLVPLGVALALIAARSPAVVARMPRLVLLSVTVRLSFLFLAVAVPSLFTTIVKRLIGRARPFVDLAGDPFHYQPFVWRADYASLPSGHATTAVAAAVAIGLVWPRLRAPFWIYALIILASRVLLAAHYPSDVVAGAMVGGVGALLVRDWFVARRLGFTIDAEGRVVGLPGPSFVRMKRVARGLLAP